MSDIDNQGNIYLFKVNNNKKTLEKGVTYVQVNNKNNKMTSLTSFCCFIVNFEYLLHLFFYGFYC